MTPSPLDRKSLRRELIAAREGLDAPLRQALSVHLAAHLIPLLDHLNPHTLAFCWPWHGEPDLIAALLAWKNAQPGRVLALPVVPEVPGPLVFHTWDPEDRMAPDRFGIPAPQDTPRIEPDAVLVPVNGFDARGFRIGYGGGFFDRTLAVSAPITIGVGFEISRLADTCPEPHDRPLDWIVTETGIAVRPA